VYYDPVRLVMVERARVDDGGTLGRVDVVLLADGSALVCWMSGGAEGGANKVRKVAPDGSLGPVAVITRTDISRSSRFPRMARQGDVVHFAWTQFGNPRRSSPRRPTSAPSSEPA
jgi:hypothetical protein